MGVIKALDGNAAIAHGVMRSKVQLVAAYPITPQTPIVETIASLIDKKEYGRISDEPIEVKSYVYRPNCVICFDTSLAEVGIDITEGIRPGCTLVVNSPVPVYEDVFAKVCNGTWVKRQ